MGTMAAKIFAVLVVASSVAAEASLGYRSTAGYHPGGAVSYSNRSPQGLSGYGGYYGGYGHGIYKREAEASFGYGSTAGYHPGGALSYSNRSPQGLSGYGDTMVVMVMVSTRGRLRLPLDMDPLLDISPVVASATPTGAPRASLPTGDMVDTDTVVFTRGLLS